MTPLGPAASCEAAGLAALAASAVLSEPLRRIAARHGLVDRPGARKEHRSPTPYLGGVAIAVSTLIPAGLLPGHWSAVLAAIIAGAVVVGALGLTDDIRPLLPLLRLLAEAAAAGFVVHAGARLPLTGVGALDAVVTTGWIVLLTNSFNLLDNMDGLAAAVASPTALCLAAAAAESGRMDLAVLLVALAAGCAGFLVHNWAPARIFMGDAGSLFIGFVVAACAAAAAAPQTVPQSAVLQAPVLPLTGVLLVTFVPTLDTTVVLISRHRARRPLLMGGRDHVSHRLRRLGLSVPQTGLALCALASGTCLAGILTATRPFPSAVVVMAVLAAMAIACRLLLRVSVYPTATRT